VRKGQFVDGFVSTAAWTAPGTFLAPAGFTDGGRRSLLLRLLAVGHEVAQQVFLQVADPLHDLPGSGVATTPAFLLALDASETSKRGRFVFAVSQFVTKAGPLGFPEGNHLLDDRAEKRTQRGWFELQRYWMFGHARLLSFEGLFTQAEADYTRPRRNLE